MARAQRPETFIRDFCSTGSWRLLPLLLVYIVGAQTGLADGSLTACHRTATAFQVARSCSQSHAFPVARPVLLMRRDPLASLRTPGHRKCQPSSSLGNQPHDDVGCYLPAGIAVVAPVVPTLMTNFMASRRAGYSVVCEEYPPGKQPPACQDAYSDVVFWSSASSFISNGLTFLLVRLMTHRDRPLACGQASGCTTVVLPGWIMLHFPHHDVHVSRAGQCVSYASAIILCAQAPVGAQSPLVGRWSDVYGRKPFMIVALVFSALPAAVLVCYLHLGTSLLWCVSLRSQHCACCLAWVHIM